MSNVELLGASGLSPWRRISMGSWRPTGDSSVFVELDLVLDHVLDQGQDGQNRNLNAIFAKLLARAIDTDSNTRQINSLIRWGRIYQRKNIDLFFHVSNSATDLAGIRIENPHRKPIDALSEEFVAEVKALRANGDQKFKKVKDLFRFVPGWCSRLVLDVTGFVSYTLNLNLSLLGVPKDAFGSIMVTNVGSLGIDGGFTVIAPYTRIPCVIAICSVQKKPIVEQDSSGTDVIVIRRVARLGMTFDHRIVDGFHIAAFVRQLKHLCLKPEGWLL